MRIYLVTALLFQCWNIFSQSDSLQFSAPQYPGGRKALSKYINEYLNFPVLLMASGKGADLKADIYLLRNGKVKFVNVTGTNVELKDQLKRILTLSPDWRPGKRYGTLIDTFVTQHIYFSIENSRIKKLDSTIIENIYYQVPLSTSEDKSSLNKQKDEAAKQKMAAEVYTQARREVDNNNNTKTIELFNNAKQLGYLTSSAFYYNLGIAYIKSGSKDSACVSFREAARMGDKDAFDFYLKNCK